LGQPAVPSAVFKGVAFMLYIDPGVGSIVLQVVLASALGALVTARRWWGTVSQRIRALFRHGR
jgi:hypothetical protein